MAQLNSELSSQLQARHRDYLAWMDEREGRRIEREAAQAERNAWQRERETWKAERDAWYSERQAWQAASDAWRAEREAERDARQAERQVWQAERREAEATRTQLTGRVEELGNCSNALFREVDALHGVIGRLQAEILAKQAELERTRTTLRPYLKIDRLGMVSALQKKVHAPGPTPRNETKANSRRDER